MSAENISYDLKRFAGIKRDYTPEEVERLRGSIKIEYSICKQQSTKLWKLLNTENYVNTLGSLSGNHAVQHAKAGLKAIYLSGWQVAADANSAGEMYPDQSLYPYDSAPKLVESMNNALIRADQIQHMELKDGDVKIELFSDTAPNHVKRIKELADAGKYDNVVFHRVIDGFMAQTGDVKFGNSNSNDFDLRRAGMGGSDLPDLKQEFSSLPHDRGTLSMARSSDPNSANSQFFICFKPAPFLDRQYTVFGKVIEGMEFVDKIKRGDQNNNGAVTDPDKIISFKSQ